MELLEIISKQKETIRAGTRRVLERIRPEQMSWQPEREALRVGEILRHLWMSEEGMRRIALDGNFAYYEKRIPEGLRAILGTPEELTRELEHLERVHQETLRGLGQFPAARLEEDRVHSGLGIQRKVYSLLLGINDHEVHHRAQLMIYLRILGAPMPEMIRKKD